MNRVASEPRPCGEGHHLGTCVVGGPAEKMKRRSSGRASMLRRKVAFRCQQARISCSIFGKLTRESTGLNMDVPPWRLAGHVQPHGGGCRTLWRMHDCSEPGAQKNARVPLLGTSACARGTTPVPFARRALVERQHAPAPGNGGRPSGSTRGNLPLSAGGSGGIFPRAARAPFHQPGLAGRALARYSAPSSPLPASRPVPAATCQC